MSSSIFENLLEHLTDLIADKVIEKRNLRVNLDSGIRAEHDPEQDFLNTEEALVVLKIKSKVTLRSYVKSGLIPKPKRIGGRKLVYRKSDLLKMMGDGK
jgi:predicted DNA-binding transcriptional regulator AlpA